jgi:membrane-bound lytic murein transglycosylase D
MPVATSTIEAIIRQSAPVPLEARPRQPVPTPESFVARLRGSFQLQHHLDRPAVQRTIDRYVAHPKRFWPHQERMATYLPYICEQVLARDMPGEICLLPVVESGLDVRAYSPMGAVGMWQFMPDTARRYGLRIDQWVDERRDPIAATVGALDHLGLLRKRLGDWLLAVAAYNCGEGRVRRALRTNPDAQSVYDLKLPRETRSLVDKLLAKAAIVAHPTHFGVALPLPANAPADASFAFVEAEEQIDLVQVAHAMGREPGELRRRNPALRRWVTHPDGPHRLLVATGDESKAEQALANQGAPQRIAWRRLRIEPNDTLGHLALRFGTDVAALAAANGLTGTLIRAGDELLVPMAEPPSANLRTADAGVGGGVYVVRAGDTLWRIARRLGLTVQALASGNGIAPEAILHIGQRLVIDD